jgi:glycosyltransferase involved in cell wall biosynthesis
LKYNDIKHCSASDTLVSVIIPCFNYARFLPDSVGSVQAQTHANWECIIINDGSSDDTAALAEQLAREDGRIKVIHQENRGQTTATNRGLEVALGQYVQFLDADDLISPDKIERQLKLLAGVDKLGLAYSDYRHCDRDNPEKTVYRDRFEPPRFKMRRPVLDIASRWETEFSIPNHSFLFDSRFFKEHGIRFDDSLKNHVDWDCWMRIFILDPVILNIPEQLAIYRIHGDSKCADPTSMSKGFLKVLNKHMLLHKNDPELNEALRTKYRQIRRLHRDLMRRRAKDKIRSCLHRLFDKYVPSSLQRVILSIRATDGKGLREGREKGK